MPRIPMIVPDELTPAQRKVYDDVIAGPRGALVGPLRAVLHVPDLAQRWSKFGEYLRFNTSLPKKLTELSILVTARRWNSQVEWHIHALAAAAAGLSASVIAAILAAQPPVFTDEAELEVYEFTRQMLTDGDVDDALHAKVTRRWGVTGVVELTSVFGYYSMVSIMLNAQDIPLPPGVAPPLEPVNASGGHGGLTRLAAAAPLAVGAGSEA